MSFLVLFTPSCCGGFMVTSQTVCRPAGLVLFSRVTNLPAACQHEDTSETCRRDTVSSEFYQFGTAGFLHRCTSCCSEPFFWKNPARIKKTASESQCLVHSIDGTRTRRRNLPCSFRRSADRSGTQTLYLHRPDTAPLNPHHVCAPFGNYHLDDCLSLKAIKQT